MLPSKINIPLTYRAVVEEITRFTDLPLAEVERRVWDEALVGGCNIVTELPVYGVTPHQFDDHMVRLYTEGTGFIYAGLVYWSSPARRSWSEQALQRLQSYTQRQGLSPAAVRILMFGDGTGNDSLWLVQHGFQVDYFDYPGSRSFDFACQRFSAYGVLNEGVRLVTDKAALEAGAYDVILSFEVLEHLPDPIEAIHDLARLLKNGGIALITEAFSSVTAALPTHLAGNKRLAGRTPFLFLDAGLHLTWYPRQPSFKPFEFTKQSGSRISTRWSLLSDQFIMKAFLKARWSNFRG